MAVTVAVQIKVGGQHSSAADAVRAMAGQAGALDAAPERTIEVQERDITNFLEAWARGHTIVSAGAGKAMVEVGTRGWTMPISVVKTPSGWRFDTRAAAEEMRICCIGCNELAAMQASLAYIDAKREYAQRDWDGDGVKSLAPRGVLAGQAQRTLLAIAARRAREPARPAFAEVKQGQPYYGQVYRILTGQGAAATGGAKSYVRNRRMTDGFALVATPAKYGDTGVMTFIVNQDGILYEKDLGAERRRPSRRCRPSIRRRVGRSPTFRNSRTGGSDAGPCAPTDPPASSPTIQSVTRWASRPCSST